MMGGLPMPTNFKLAAPKSEEHMIQSSVIKWARVVSVRYRELDLLYAIPNGGARDVITGARLKAEGVKPGIPDLCLPVARGGSHALYVEIKTPIGVISKKQEDVIAKLTRFGNKVAVCRSAQEAIDTIMEYVKGQITTQKEKSE